MSRCSENSKMEEDTGKRPMLFTKLGATHGELLAHGYGGQNFMFSISRTTSSGTTLTSTAANNLKRLVEDVDSVNFISGNLALTAEFLPSTTAEAVFTIPDYTSSQFSMWFLHRDATLSMTAAQRPFPAIELAATIGNPSISFGLVVGMMRIFPTRWFSHLTAAIQVKRPTWDAFMLLHSDCLLASYVHYLDKAKKISVGVAIPQCLITQESNFIAGGSWAINHLSTVKARIDLHGKLKALLHHNITEKACLTISGKFDIKYLNKVAGIGLAIALEL